LIFSGFDLSAFTFALLSVVWLSPFPFHLLPSSAFTFPLSPFTFFLPSWLLPFLFHLWPFLRRLRVGNAPRAVQSSFRALPVPSPSADAATPVIEEQLAKAGVRLAMVLNRLWP
jgi:hypothetical protein